MSNQSEAEKQEPVIGVEVKRIASGGFIGNVWWIHENLQEGVFHLYTHPQPKREPLTDEEIAEFFGVKAVDESFVEFVRAIEAAHGITGNMKQEHVDKTAKQRHEWVGLTDEEREEATGWSVEHIEAKLKEKNT